MDKTRDVIVQLARARTNLQDIGLDDDYFDAGVSSLTIIGLQIEVEEKLGVSIETRELMRFSTINQWIEAYAKKISVERNTSHGKVQSNLGAF